MASTLVDETSVFLNVPFDDAYERQFLALIGALLALGRSPRCVLEIADSGEGRLKRIIGHLKRCRISIHDLSRGNRFNMPFELGLACAAAVSKTPKHDFYVFDRERYRLSRRLSDLAGIDHSVHNGTVRGTIACVLDVLTTTTTNPNPDEVYSLYQDLSRLARKLKQRYGRQDIFNRAIFGQLVIGGTRFAQKRGMLDP